MFLLLQLIMRRIVILILLLSAQMAAVQVNVRVAVVDSETDEPLTAASAVVKGTDSNNILYCHSNNQAVQNLWVSTNINPIFFIITFTDIYLSPIVVINTSFLPLRRHYAAATDHRYSWSRGSILCRSRFGRR